jgi:hypothetical protein
MYRRAIRVFLPPVFFGPFWHARFDPRLTTGTTVTKLMMTFLTCTRPWLLPMAEHFVCWARLATWTSSGDWCRLWDGQSDASELLRYDSYGL